MKEFLKTQMWFAISNKLNRTVLESQGIILQIKERFDNDLHFHIQNYDNTTIDAFEYYLESIKYLE
ncbi:hypothetical protein [Wocania ichthyoenteri]|uniref:hypothetical protein n=1 Tax=Wocania ichthyoenteri TaxID=1230531 RepID=UPI00053D5EAB|nr:hypothetical protein [Wocania ichthyoenteri]